MKKIFYAAVIPAALLFASCSNDKSREEEVEEITEEDFKDNPLGTLAKMGKNLQDQAKKMEERQKSGKKYKVVHYEKLIEYLPEIPGYTKGEPDGGTINNQGFSVSNADATYTNGEQKVDVSIVDYSAAYSLFTAMTMGYWGSGFSIDTRDEMAKGFSVSDNIKGWETFKKKGDKEAAAILGIDDRFWVSVSSDNQESTDFVKDVAKSIDFDKLLTEGELLEE